MSVVNTSLRSWHSPLFSSPQHKGSIFGYTSSLWNPKPAVGAAVDPSTAWPNVHLQPSTNIWGSQVERAKKPAVFDSYASTPITLNHSINLNGIQAQQQPAVHSASLSSPLSAVSYSSSLLYSDTYLVSPPPSPPAAESASASFGLQAPAAKELVQNTNNDAIPTDNMIISATCGPLYLVKFKGNRINVFTAPGTMIYKAGDVVMVDADRGRDLGTIVAGNVSRQDAAALKQRHHSDRHLALRASSPAASSNQSQSSPVVYTPKQILAQASPSEIKDMEAKEADEAAAVALCTKKAIERNLDMAIVDAEYQWDRRKLTFFYVANSRVDFRDLVRELFRIYKTRIWMCATSARS